MGRVAGIRMVAAPQRRSVAVAWFASSFLSTTRQVSAAGLCAASRILKGERRMIAKVKRLRMNWTLIKKHVGAYLATSALKAAHMTCLQCVINRVNAVVCGHRSARHLAGAMTAASSTIRNAAAAFSMHRSQQATRQE